MKETFTNLTIEQQKSFGNGCGIYSRFLRIPQFIFTASCRHHDFNYSRGGNLKDKVKADFDFLKCMLSDAKYSQKPVFYSCMSIVYFVGVSIFGFPFFKYGKYRTLQEILDAQ